MSNVHNFYASQVLKTLCILAKSTGASALRFAVVMIGDMFLDMAKYDAFSCPLRVLPVVFDLSSE
jgi:hypothetical protein